MCSLVTQYSKFNGKSMASIILHHAPILIPSTASDDFMIVRGPQVEQQGDGREMASLYSHTRGHVLDEVYT